MLLSDIAPFVRQALIARVNAMTEYDIFYKLKAHDARLYYILGGDGKMTIDGHTYQLQRATVVVFRAGVEYSWHPSQNSHIEYMTVNFDFTQEYTHLIRPYHPIHAESFPQGEELLSSDIEDAQELNHPLILQDFTDSEHSFRAIVTEYAVGGELKQLFLSSTLKALLISTVRESRKRSDGGTVCGSSLASRIANHLHKYYMNRIDYEELGREFHMSPIYLNRIFRKYIKTSIHEYLLNYRISVAMDMLRSSNASVKEIASAVGFNDFPHFSKTFKRITGCSPKDDREGI